MAAASECSEEGRSCVEALAQSGGTGSGSVVPDGDGVDVRASRHAPVADHLLDTITRLKKEQAAAQDMRKALRTELKNAQRRRSRLKHRARQLSDKDLMDVLQMRGMKDTTRTPAAAKQSAQAQSSAEKKSASTEGDGGLPSPVAGTGEE